MRRTGFAVASFILISFFLVPIYLWGQVEKGDSERLKRIEKMDTHLKMRDIAYRSYLTEPHTDDAQWLEETSVPSMGWQLKHLEEGLKGFEQNLERDSDTLRTSPSLDGWTELDLKDNIKHEREMIDGIKERTQRIRKRLSELEEAEKKMGPDPIETLERERGEIEKRLKEMNEKYGFKANETLRVAFQQRGVKGKTALEYADSWELHRLAWLNEAQPFYTYHRDMLNAFIADFRNKKTVSQGQIAYFVQRMGIWKNMDRELDSLLEQMVRSLADDAYEEDQRHQLLDKINAIEKKYQEQARKAPDRNYTKIMDEKNRATDPLYKEVKDHEQRAREAWNKAMALKKQIKEIGAKQLFYYSGKKPDDLGSER